MLSKGQNDVALKPSKANLEAPLENFLTDLDPLPSTGVFWAQLILFLCRVLLVFFSLVLAPC